MSDYYHPLANLHFSDSERVRVAIRGSPVALKPPAGGQIGAHDRAKHRQSGGDVACPLALTLSLSEVRALQMECGWCDKNLIQS